MLAKQQLNIISAFIGHIQVQNQKKGERKGARGTRPAGNNLGRLW